MLIFWTIFVFCVKCANSAIEQYRTAVSHETTVFRLLQYNELSRNWTWLTGWWLTCVCDEYAHCYSSCTVQCGTRSSTCSPARRDDARKSEHLAWACVSGELTGRRRYEKLLSPESHNHIMQLYLWFPLHRWEIQVKVKVKVNVDLYSALSWSHTSKALRYGTPFSRVVVFKL